jgi:hypothetical protein
MPVSDTLIKILEAYCHVNATNIVLLAEHYKKEDWSYCRPEKFREDLRTVIKTRSISIAEYEEITNEEFDSLNELYQWLTDIWGQVVDEEL